MRNALYRLSPVILGCFLFVSSSTVTRAQQESGAVRISGRVSPALKLATGGSLQLPDGARAVIESSGPDFIEIQLSGDEQSDGRLMTIPLELRTNVGYELKLALLSSSGCAPRLAASIGAIQASGAAVMAGAAEASRPSDIIRLEQPGDKAIGLSGPRISARGNFTTAGNALRVNLNIAATKTVESACPWRASLRISLQPGASF
jgi:hypothetical protein